MITSTDDLLRLAPDPKTLEAGRRLFYSRRWRLLGGDGKWLWGEFIYGNSNKASETAVELTTGRYFCNCRARQRPCAHGLGLVLILKNDQERLVVGQPPSWVRSVQFRAEDRPKPNVDKAAANTRLEERLELMTAGVEELELRLLDLTRRGIADALGAGPDVFLSAAARLTDAKLPGPAGQLRRLAALGNEGTESAVARTLGDLYLFVRAWKNRDGLPTARRQELDRYAGLKTSKEELGAQPSTDDLWLVMGVTQGQEDKLRFRRVWLRGQRTRRFALLLDYAFGNMAFEQSWPLGAAFSGEVTYYPGSYAQRAVLPRPRPARTPYDGLKGYADFAAMRGNYQLALAANPWLYSYPVYLESVTPRRAGRKTFLLDDNGEALLLPEDYVGFYRLLGISGGEPISLFGEFDGETFRALTVVYDGSLVDA